MTGPFLPVQALRALSLALGLAALAGSTGAQAPAAEAGIEFEVRYVANEGFLVSGAAKRLLVDALFAGGVPGYPVAAAEIRERIERGTGHWQEVQVALATHYHRDHFDPGSVARFLRSNPDAVFVSTPQAVAKLRDTLGEEAGLLDRVRGVLPEAGTVENLLIHGIRIDVLNLHHGPGNPPVENLGFVVTLGNRRFLHFGDTEAKMVDFEPYLGLLRGVDLGILPFWFLSSEWRAEMVRDRIRPRWIVVGHMPVPTAPAGHFARWRSHAGLVEAIGSAFPEATFPGRSGERFAFAADN